MHLATDRGRLRIPRCLINTVTMTVPSTILTLCTATQLQESPYANVTGCRTRPYSKPWPPRSRTGRNTFTNSCEIVKLSILDSRSLDPRGLLIGDRAALVIGFFIHAWRMTMTCT